MKKTFITSLFLIAAFGVVIAQDSSSSYRHILKLNIVAPALVKAGMLSYEHQIKPNFSLVGGIGTKFKGKLPKFYQNEKLGLDIMTSGVSGTYFNLEGRWYPKKCNCTQGLEGFYVAPYFRLNSYRMNATLEFVESPDFTSVNRLDGRLQEYGVGVMLGYQFFIWKRLVVDFLFFGPRTSRYKLNMDFDQAISDQFLDALSTNINETLDRLLQNGGVDLNARDSNLRSTFSSLNFRYAISIGVGF